MIVTTWHNGSPNFETGSGFGLRLRKEDRDEFFKGFTEVEIQPEGEEGIITVDIENDSFWGNCPELRSSQIGLWLIQHNYHDWDNYSTNKLELTLITGNRFLLGQELIEN